MTYIRILKWNEFSGFLFYILMPDLGANVKLPTEMLKLCQKTDNSSNNNSNRKRYERICMQVCSFFFATVLGIAKSKINGALKL